MSSRYERMKASAKNSMKSKATIAAEIAEAEKAKAEYERTAEEKRKYDSDQRAYVEKVGDVPCTS
jgi:chaperonin cofactor prefoldin